jgi:hypothetical protein
VDHYLSQRVRGYFRYIQDAWQATNPTPGFGTGGAASFGVAETDFEGPSKNIVASVTATLSPTLVNEFAYGYSTSRLTMNTVNDFSRPSSMTMTSLFPNSFGGRLPAISLVESGTLYTGGFSQNIGWYPWVQSQPEFSFRDQVSKNFGNHNMYFGFNYAKRKKDGQFTALLNGTLNFNNTSPLSTGNAFADFLTGKIASFSQDSAKPTYNGRAQSTEFFYQDDWRVSRTLTLNLGVRLSLYGAETDPQTYNFDPRFYELAKAPQVDATGSITGSRGALVPNSGDPFEGLVQCGGPDAPPGCVNRNFFTPAPRVGFAWDPSASGKMSIRGGYGFFYEWTNGNEGAPQLRGAPVVLNATQFNIDGYTNIGGGGLLQPLTKTALNPNNKWPYVQQWNLNVQREIMKGTVASIAYVGSKGTRLLSPGMDNLNQNPIDVLRYGDGLIQQASARPDIAALPYPGFTGTVAQALRPFPQYLNITQKWPNFGTSMYNSVQLTLTRHFSQGFGVLVAYTFSKAITNTDDPGPDGITTISQDVFNRQLERSTALFNVPQFLKVTWIYELPIGPGKLLNVAGIAGKILGGWRLTGIHNYRSGNALQISTAGLNNVLFSGTLRPDWIPDVPTVIDTGKDVTFGAAGTPYLNPAAFAQIPRTPNNVPLRLGTAPRVLPNVRGPYRLSEDFGVEKKFQFTETMDVEVRADFINAFNRSGRGDPQTNITSPLFGMITSFQQGPRSIQLGARFTF